MTNLGKFSIGVGDRFARQAKAQLQACILAGNAGVDIIPVWNKSIASTLSLALNRFLSALQPMPPSPSLAGAPILLRRRPHQPNHRRAIPPSCDFYTIDVADYIGKPAESASTRPLCQPSFRLRGVIPMQATIRPLNNSGIASHHRDQIPLRHSGGRKDSTTALNLQTVPAHLLAEVSMDETDSAQTPAELLIILATIADESIPIQTIAPKFSGRFNKGVDYVGDPAQFAREMALDIAAIQHAVAAYGLPSNLKLSVHSGSDKFSIYPAIHSTIKQFSAGVHLKTAGTTWLEELIGLAEAGGDGLALAKEIYAEAFAHPRNCVRHMRRSST